jgi:DNA-binding MarR family transcriptional regulator
VKAETIETGQDFVSGYLLYLLAAVSHRASGQFHDRARQAGLRVPEWRVLACLWGEDGAMVTHLAALSLMEQSRLTKTLDQMVRRGLVTRRSDPADGRRVRVYLSDRGRELAEVLVAEATAHEAAVLGLLDAGEAARIKPILRKLLEGLGPV